MSSPYLHTTQTNMQVNMMNSGTEQDGNCSRLMSPTHSLLSFGASGNGKFDGNLSNFIKQGQHEEMSSASSFYDLNQAHNSHEAGNKQASISALSCDLSYDSSIISDMSRSAAEGFSVKAPSSVSSSCSSNGSLRKKAANEHETTSTAEQNISTPDLVDALYSVMSDTDSDHVECDAHTRFDAEYDTDFVSWDRMDELMKTHEYGSWEARMPSSA